MKKLSTAQIMKLHKKMVTETGGSNGLRSLELLESALNNAYATFDGADLYQNVESKCAIICFGIISNHPFVDGNKRMGVYIMLVLLRLNEISLKFSQQELISLGLGVAKGEIKYTQILEWILSHKDFC